MSSNLPGTVGTSISFADQDHRHISRSQGTFASTAKLGCWLPAYLQHVMKVGPLATAVCSLHLGMSTPSFMGHDRIEVRTFRLSCRVPPRAVTDVLSSPGEQFTGCRAWNKLRHPAAGRATPIELSMHSLCVLFSHRAAPRG